MRIIKLAKVKEFSSMSDFIIVAVTRFLSEIESEKRLTNQQRDMKKMVTRPVVIE